MIDEKRLDDIETRSKAIGAGPWCVDPDADDDQVGVVFCDIDGDVKCIAVFGDPQDGCGGEDEDNAAFAAAAHADVPDLVAEVRRQRKILDVWSEALAEIHLSHPHLVDEDTLMAKGNRHSTEVRRLKDEIADFAGNGRSAVKKPKWTRDDGKHLLSVGTRLAEVYHDDEGWTLEAWQECAVHNRCGYIDGFHRFRDAKAAGEAWVLGKPLRMC